MCKHSITIEFVNFNVVEQYFKRLDHKWLIVLYKRGRSSDRPSVYRARLSGDLRRLALWLKVKITYRDSEEPVYSGSKWIFRCATLHADEIRVLVLNIWCVTLKRGFLKTAIMIFKSRYLRKEK